MSDHDLPQRVPYLLPDIGERVHEAELIAWRIGVGDRVRAGDIIAEMETDKAVIEVPAPFSGRIVELHAKPGDHVAVGSPLVTFDGASIDATLDSRDAAVHPSPDGTHSPHAERSPLLVAPRPFPWFTGFLVLAMLALSVLVVVLSNQNRKLKSMLMQQHDALVKDALAVGERVTPLSIIDATGAESTLDFSAHSATLIVAVSTHCGYCDESLPIWSRAVEDAKAIGVRVVCVHTDARQPAEFKATPPNLPGVLVPRVRETWLKRLPMVPAALMVSREGEITNVWFGQADKAMGEEMTDALLRAIAAEPKK